MIKHSKNPHNDLLVVKLGFRFDFNLVTFEQNIVPLYDSVMVNGVEANRRVGHH